MTIGGYDAFDDPYAYKGTSVLKNRLKTRDAAVLAAFEMEMTALRAEEPLPGGRFGPTHYCAVHRHLFQDIYRWAGRYRTVRTAKDGNWFCFPENIPREMKRVFDSLRRGSFLADRQFGEFAAGAADFLAELNAIHPFREGNGRAQLSFLHLLALRAGHPLDLSRIHPEPFLRAMATSFAGDLKPLIREIVSLGT
ncbi:MAG: adenosine monophosphate-protein transferase [Alphaproteobacteria bacterium]|nr:adenosine monophosphate-protein transferase [Alphaproteobacteria bacterium]